MGIKLGMEDYEHYKLNVSGQVYIFAVFMNKVATCAMIYFYR